MGIPSGVLKHSHGKSPNETNVSSWESHLLFAPEVETTAGMWVPIIGWKMSQDLQFCLAHSDQHLPLWFGTPRCRLQIELRGQIATRWLKSKEQRSWSGSFQEVDSTIAFESGSGPMIFKSKRPRASSLRRNTETKFRIEHRRPYHVGSRKWKVDGSST